MTLNPRNGIAFCILTCVSVAQAQNQPQPSAQPPAQSPITPVQPSNPAVQPSQRVDPNFMMAQHWQRSSDMFGRPIVSDGVSIGKVEDFMIDPDSGRIVYGINSFSDVHEGDGRLFPVPWQASRYSAEDNAFNLSVRADRLPSAMSFPTGQWPDFNDQEFALNTFRSYNQTPWWEVGDAVADNPAPWTDPRNPSSRTPAKLVSDPVRSPTYGQRWVQRPAGLQRASELRGREIRAADGTRAGIISEVVVDAENGRVLYAVEGSGDRRVPIPWNALQPRPDNTFQLSINAEQLKNAPAFTGDDWPNMIDRSWAENLHRYYRVDPYWNMGAAPR